MTAPYTTWQNNVDIVNASIVNNIQSDVSSLGVNARAYGAVSDGTTDDSAAVQAAIDYVRNSWDSPVAHGTTVIIPDNTYVASSIDVTNRSGIVIKGESIKSRIISGASGKAVFDLLGAQDIVFENLLINGKNGSEPAVALFLGRTTGGPNSSGIRFKDVYITGYFTMGAVYGVATAVHHWQGLFINLSGKTTVKFAIELVPTNVESLTSDYQSISGATTSGDSICIDNSQLSGPDVSTFTPLVVYEGYTGVSLKRCYVSGGTSNQAVLIKGGVAGIIIDDDCNFETSGCSYTVYFDTYASTTNSNKSSRINISDSSLAYKVAGIGANTGTTQEGIDVANNQNNFFSPATEPAISLKTVSYARLFNWNYPNVSGTLTITTATSCEVWAHDGTTVTITSATGLRIYNGNGYEKFLSRNVFAAQTTAPVDAQLTAGSVSLYLDEAGHNLKVRALYSNGSTYKTATIALT